MNSPAAGTQEPSAGAGRAGLAMAGAARAPSDEAEAAAAIVADYRRSRGIGAAAAPVQIPLAKLIPNQSILPGKAAAMVTASAESFPPIWVSRASRDGRHTILDGHHRVRAAMMRGDASITAMIGTVRDGSFYPDPPPSEPTTETEQEAARIVAAFHKTRRART
jgi:hypothetical protein